LRRLNFIAVHHPGMALGGQPEFVQQFFDLELACEKRKSSCVELLNHPGSRASYSAQASRRCSGHGGK
jgi:hypothetical protein